MYLRQWLRSLRTPALTTVSTRVNAHVRGKRPPTWPVIHIDPPPPPPSIGGWIHTASLRTHFMLFRTKWAKPGVRSFSGCFLPPSAMAASNEKHILGNCNIWCLMNCILTYFILLHIIHIFEELSSPLTKWCNPTGQPFVINKYHSLAVLHTTVGPLCECK